MGGWGPAEPALGICLRIMLALSVQSALKTRGSQIRGGIYLRGHLAMCRDSFVTVGWVGGCGCYWHPAGGGKGCCRTPCSAQGGLHNVESSGTIVNSAEVEKCWARPSEGNRTRKHGLMAVTQRGYGHPHREGCVSCSAIREIRGGNSVKSQL